MEIQPGEQVIEILGQTLILSPQKAMYWIEQGTLLLADVHLGKETHFRKKGIAAPGNILYDNLQKMDLLVQRFEPARTIFLGDLFHSVYNDAWLPFTAWMKEYPNISFELVEGNHDILDKRLYEQAGMKVHKEPYLVAPFLLSHHPMEEIADGNYNLYGHIHPGVALQGPAKQYMKLPCFLFQKTSGIMPAFGQFTGLAMVKPGKEDAIWVVGDEKVISLQ
jgi:DNA ligase-associated metallophosphoesterase